MEIHTLTIFDVDEGNWSKGNIDLRLYFLYVLYGEWPYFPFVKVYPQPSALLELH